MKRIVVAVWAVCACGGDPSVSLIDAGEGVADAAPACELSTCPHGFACAGDECEPRPNLTAGMFDWIIPGAGIRSVAGVGAGRPSVSVQVPDLVLEDGPCRLSWYELGYYPYGFVNACQRGIDAGEVSVSIAGETFTGTACSLANIAPTSGDGTMPKGVTMTFRGSGGTDFSAFEISVTTPMGFEFSSPEVVPGQAVRVDLPGISDELELVAMDEHNHLECRAPAGTTSMTIPAALTERFEPESAHVFATRHALAKQLLPNGNVVELDAYVRHF